MDRLIDALDRFLDKLPEFCKKSQQHQIWW